MTTQPKQTNKSPLLLREGKGVGLFRRACTDYRLLEDGDRILIGVSGGKDSLLLCKLLAERQKIHRPAIRVEAAHVVMDGIPYQTDLEWLRGYCAELGLPLHVLHAQFPTEQGKEQTPCRRCALTRRRTLFAFAAEHDFNKVALGHHQDDILVTLLLNLTYEGSASTMRPSMPMEHYPITIIRPLCLCREEWIAAEAQALAFPAQLQRCPYETTTRRTDMEALFHQLEALNPEARHSLWHAAMKEQGTD